MDKNLKALSQITSKQIADSAILPEHLSDMAIHYAFSKKTIGIARILENINIPAGTSEIDITKLIYRNSINSSPSIRDDINGVFTSGSEYMVVSGEGGKLAHNGRCFYGLGVPKTESFWVASNDKNLIALRLTKYPVVRGSLEIRCKCVVNGQQTDVIITDKKFYEGYMSDNINPDEKLQPGRIDYNTGNLEVQLNYNLVKDTEVKISYRYRGYENYKVLVRNWKSKTPLVGVHYGLASYESGYESGHEFDFDGEVYGELYAVEYYPINEQYMPINIETKKGERNVRTTATGNELYGNRINEGPQPPDPPNTDLTETETEEGYYPICYGSVANNFSKRFDVKNSILCTAKNPESLQETSLGLVSEIVETQNLSQTTYHMVLEDRANCDYSGNCKMVRYRIRFYFFDKKWKPVRFVFNNPTKIDLLILEAGSLSSYELTPNIYKYINFHKLGTTIVPVVANEMDEELVGENIVMQTTKTIRFNGADYVVPAVVFRVSNQAYYPGTLKVYVDGVMVMRYDQGDNPFDMRFVEDDWQSGTFSIINIDYGSIFKGGQNNIEEDVGNQHVYVTYRPFPRQ